MKLESKDNSLLFSNTELPDIFFTEYLNILNGDFIKVYLYCIFLSKHNKEIKINDISKSLNLSFKIIQDAFINLENNNLITKKMNGYIINNIQEIELNKLYSPKFTISKDNMENNNYRIKAIESINNSYFQGIMSPSWYSDIDLWFKKYSFDEQVMLALFNYCYNKSALHRNYVQTVADAWFKNNIKTFTDLEKYEQKQEIFYNIKKQISKKLGLSRQLTQFEEAYIQKWTVDFSYSLEIIEIALKKTTSKSNPSFDYLDKLLSDWHDRNLNTTLDIENFLNSIKEKNQNIKNLEKKSGYNSYDQRNYENFDSLYANNKKSS